MKKNLKISVMNDSSNNTYTEIAAKYDAEVKAYGSYAHEVIFGMCYEFVSADEKIIDVGIGTGLGSEQLSKIGLRVFGVDNSKEMLRACRAKSFAEKLSESDITKEPLPYRNDYFNHAICCGVLHFFGDLSKLFSEITRVLKSGGIFAFSIAPTKLIEGYTEEPTAWGIPIFQHSSQYIQTLLAENNMLQMKEQRILMKGEDKKSYNMPFSVIISRYQQ